MRFKHLRGLTVLPIEAIRSQFRGEDVRTVLPATAEGPDVVGDAVLVATSSALAIVSGEPGPGPSRWQTRWAPWEVVRLSEGMDSMIGTVEESYGLVVHVGRLRFESRLIGEAGRRALRDFVIAAGPSAGPAHP